MRLLHVRLAAVVTRVMRKLKLWAVWCGLLVLLVLIALIAPLPPKRTVYEEISPDGTMRAVYSWRPAGLVGSFSQDNPWVYVDVYELTSGRRLAHYSSWGDVPWDGIERLHRHLPWAARRTNGFGIFGH